MKIYNADMLVAVEVVSQEIDHTYKYVDERTFMGVKIREAGFEWDWPWPAWEERADRVRVGNEIHVRPYVRLAFAAGEGLIIHCTDDTEAHMEASEYAALIPNKIVKQ